MYVLKGDTMLQYPFFAPLGTKTVRKVPSAEAIISQLHGETTTPASATLCCFRLNSGESATVMRRVNRHCCVRCGCAGLLGGESFKFIQQANTVETAKKVQ